MIACLHHRPPHCLVEGGGEATTGHLVGSVVAKWVLARRLVDCGRHLVGLCGDLKGIDGIAHWYVACPPLSLRPLASL